MHVFSWEAEDDRGMSDGMNELAVMYADRTTGKDLWIVKWSGPIPEKGLWWKNMCFICQRSYNSLPSVLS